MIRDVVGFDVDSKYLVGYRISSDEWTNTPNDRKGILAFLKELPKDVIIALEATGSYSSLVAALAHKRGHTVYLLQPGKVGNFCKSSPSRGKSDKHDARDIAFYVRSFECRLHPFQPLPTFEAKLRNLHRKKEGLTNHVASLRLTLRSLGDTPKQIENTLDKLVKRIQRIQKDIDALLASVDKAQVLFTIPGVKSNLISAVLPALRTIPFKDKYALDSYAGIDLRMHESGQSKGRRYISHQGDSYIRRSVYLAGMTATTCKVWKPYYKKLLDEKKLKPVQAINALGRKLLHTVYGVYTTQTEFKAPTYG